MCSMGTHRRRVRPDPAAGPACPTCGHQGRRRDPTPGDRPWLAGTGALPDLAPQRFTLDRDRTALVLIDLQYVDASRSRGWGPMLVRDHPATAEYYFGRVERIVVPNAVRLLTSFRSEGLRVIHVTLGPVLKDGSDLAPLRRGDPDSALETLASWVGSEDHSILDVLQPRDGELCVNKTSRSAFSSTALDQLLRNLGITGLVVAGVTTGSCVDTTARDAADRGYLTVIVEDACAELDEPSHLAALRQFVVRWGRVWSTSEALAHLGMDAGTQPG